MLAVEDFFINRILSSCFICKLEVLMSVLAVIWAWWVVISWLHLETNIHCKTFCGFRVAAEWILRCGGAVKFKNFEKWIQNYNAIPDGPKGKFFLEAISAKGISVTTGGLQHLGITCISVKPLKFVNTFFNFHP